MKMIASIAAALLLATGLSTGANALPLSAPAKAAASTGIVVQVNGKGFGHFSHGHRNFGHKGFSRGFGHRSFGHRNFGHRNFGNRGFSRGFGHRGFSRGFGGHRR